jgi:tetraacyldisaccharide 4'-kinase
MLARAVPEAAVLVCSSRYLAGRLAEGRLGCTVHILDDGFQHLNLMRDIDRLVTAPSDFADVRTLPFGRFREPLDAARSADALLVPLDEQVTGGEMAERLRVKRAFGFSRRIRTSIAPGPAFAFAGIAKPERFFGDLEKAGWPLTGRQTFPDHHRYTSIDLADINRTARDSGAAVIVTTAKDEVRIPPEASGVGRTSERLPVIVVALEISIEPAFHTWLRERLAVLRAA